jgi:LSD1 subclass zinc finger protein
MSDFQEPTRKVSDALACENCGATLNYQPGTTNVACAYCGTQVKINTTAGVVETDLEEYLAKVWEDDETLTVAVVSCRSCGGRSTLPANVASDTCPFCASNLVVRDGTTSSIHRPQYVLPFSFGPNLAQERFRIWLKKLWFAPGDLKKYADIDGKLNGMYLPYWTFDCTTDTSYSGMRGEYYYTTETYTHHENGRSETRTRQVRHTQWWPAEGRVRGKFDDLLIEGSLSLPKHKLRKLEPWDTKNVVPYNDQYLAGFRTEVNVVNIKSAYSEAKGRMQPRVEAMVENDIGGDEQQISSMDTRYLDPSFKHVLMPVWISAYRYQNKAYQFIINARTGEVQGERPYSVLKIVFFILGIIAFILFLAAL